jgi:hypothetical protein
MYVQQMPLFDAEGVVVPDSVPFRKRPVAPPSWQLADHACRFCFGRVLVRKVKGRVVEARCAECSKSAQSGPEGICCCGADCGALGKALECFRNPSPSAENPQEIMVREVAREAAEEPKPIINVR